jgi:GT2 family glycosyltransferase
MRFGCVLLTRGGRPELLREAVQSLLRQEGVEVDVVVVGNGWEPAGLPKGARGVWLRENVGIPAGRNAGVPETDGELLFFLDDDAALDSHRTLARLAEQFKADPSLGLVQLRVEPREGGVGPRDWVPRLRASSRLRSGDVTLVWEGAVAMPRRVFEEVGGWPGELWLIHEGVDLAWRVMEAGYRVRYEADLVAFHPRPVAGAVRHDYTLYYQARNRVFLARRYLWAPLGAVYVTSFALRTLPRLRSFGQLRTAARGYRDGVRKPCGERRRLSARTLWRMTRAGRPPLI